MRFLAFILILFIVPIASAGVVQTLDGKSYTGDVRLSGGDQVSVTPAGAAPVKISLDEILSVQLKDASPVAAASARWIGHDLGSPPVLGSARFVGGNVIVRGSGADIGMDRDQGYFVYQQIAGDGQITARLTSIGKTSVLAKAGVMIRGGLDKGAPSAFAMLQANGRAAFRYRGRPTAVSTTVGERDIEMPAWVRLVRRGDRITASVSEDGIDWDELGWANVRISGPAMIGVAVSAHNNNAICTAAFEKVTVGGVDAVNSAGPGSPSRGIMLRDGSILSGDVRSANDSAIRLRREDQEISIPPTDVSRIVFVPLGAQMMARLARGRVGLLLANGDVVEGEFKSISEGRVAVSSVLFGLQKFNLAEVAAVILNDAAPAAAARNFEVRTVDGSIILVDKLSSDAQMLIADTFFAGKMKLAQEEIVEIRAGRSRFKPLTDIKPSSTTGAAEGVSIITSASGKISVRGQLPTRMIRLSTNTSVSYKLDGGYRLLALRFAVPDGILPLAPVRLVVLADGREIRRTPPTTSLEDPAVVAVKLAGAKSLTLRLESDGLVELGSAAVLIDPSLIQ